MHHIILAPALGEIDPRDVMRVGQGARSGSQSLRAHRALAAAEAIGWPRRPARSIRQPVNPCMVLGSRAFAAFGRFRVTVLTTPTWATSTLAATRPSTG